MELFRGEVLLMLRQLSTLLTGNGWTTDAPARDEHQVAVHPLDPKAKAWCLMGGCQRIAWNEPDAPRRETRYNQLLWAICRQDIDFLRFTPAKMNDQLGQVSVLAFIQRAIRREEMALEDL